METEAEWGEGNFFPTIQQRIFPQQAHSVTREFEDAGKGREGEVGGGRGGREGGRGSGSQISGIFH